MIFYPPPPRFLGFPTVLEDSIYRKNDYYRLFWPWVRSQTNQGQWGKNLPMHPNSLLVLQSNQVWAQVPFPFVFLIFLSSQKFQIPCSSLLSISFVILTYKTKTLYFLLNEWMDVLQCLVPSRNTIKVSREKATSKRKTNSIKGNAHKSIKCVVKYTVALKIAHHFVL